MRLRPHPEEDIVFADFESEDWGDWVAEGAAFEGGPFPVKSRSVEQKITGHAGQRIANSYNTRLGGDHIAADTRTGTLVSPEFTVERNSIRMTVGGGNREGVYVAVIVDGKEVARVAGKNSSTLYPVSIDMTAYQGKKARIRIVDEVKGGWAHITVDQIIFSDGTGAGGGIEDKHGYGSTTLTLLHDAREEGLTVSAAPSLTDPDSPSGLFEQAKPLAQQEEAVKPLNELLVGGLFAAFQLAPGESRTVDFAVTWYFPDYNEIDAAPGQMSEKTQDFRNLRRHYAPVVQIGWGCGRTILRATRNAFWAAPASGTGPGTTARCRTGCSTGVSSRSIASRRRCFIGSTAAGRMGGKGWTVVPALVPTSGTMPRRWDGSSPSWSEPFARWWISRPEWDSIPTRA